VPKIPGIPHQRAVKALEKAGFHVARQGRHIVMIGNSSAISGTPLKEISFWLFEIG
jgi:predicted RNA binding protein YcfA (HicA-like mRNA interferase family)